MTELVQPEVAAEDLIPGETYLIQMIPRVRSGVTEVQGIDRLLKKLRGVFVENIQEADPPRTVSQFRDLEPAGEHGQTHPRRSFGRNDTFQYKYYPAHAARLEAKRAADTAKLYKRATTARIKEGTKDKIGEDFDYSLIGGRRKTKRRRTKRRRTKRRRTKRRKS